jgi:hypothetical protein
VPSPAVVSSPFSFFSFFFFLFIDTDTAPWHIGDGTWPSGQKGALASWRSQVRIPVMAVN